MELRGTEERTEQATVKYIAKLQMGGVGGGTGFLSGGGINNLELDMMLNSLKEEMKTYAERVVSQNSEKLIEQRHNSEIHLFFLLDATWRKMQCLTFVSAYSVELERKYRDMFMEYKGELELADTDNRIHQKTLLGEMLD